MKSLVVDPPGNERMSQALHYTEEALKELDDTSRRLGFEYVVYLIVPVQDIIRGTADETLATFNSVSPKPAIATAQALTGEPTQYYFAYDGHLNVEGSRRVADMLIAQDRHQ
jgi:hypothetical protein